MNGPWEENTVNVCSLTQSEVSNIILGMEISPPLLQCQQIVATKAQAKDHS